MSIDNVGMPLSKLYSLTPLSEKGTVRGISLRWNAMEVRVTWRVDVSK